MEYSPSEEAKSLRIGTYEHFKGNKYKVMGVVRHSETQEEMVLYQALYGDHGLWVRPLPMFLEDVEKDGVRVPRFRCLEPNPNQKIT